MLGISVLGWTTTPPPAFTLQTGVPTALPGVERDPAVVSSSGLGPRTTSGGACVHERARPQALVALGRTPTASATCVRSERIASMDV